uniref:G-protein coupled receptors family 1 profile domain-containing protein n=1 Tax=Periophthalmus magnuspinnatus TaxID=409849 RepID=A0A3B4B8L9_9GOBI
PAPSPQRGVIPCPQTQTRLTETLGLMWNASVSSLVLDSVYAGSLAPLFLALALLLFLGIVALNVFLVAVIIAHAALHAPVYVFMCSLFLNGTVGGSSLLPFLLAQLSNLTHRVSLTSCGLQMFLMYTYSSVEFFNLAAMAYDRYVAICFPLSYRQRLNPGCSGTCCPPGGTVYFRCSRHKQIFTNIRIYKTLQK